MGERHRRRRTPDAVTVLVPLLVVGLVAAGLGYALGAYLTRAIAAGAGAVSEPPPATTPPGDTAVAADDPASVPGASESIDAASNITITIAPHNFYVVQLGAFSSPDGAQAFVNQLEAQGYAAAVVKTGAGDRVWSGLFADRVQGRAFAELFVAAGFDAFVVERTVGGSGAVTAEPQVLVEQLQALPGNLKAVTSLLPGATTDAGHRLPAAAAVEALAGIDRAGLLGNGPELARRLLEVYERLAECERILVDSRLDAEPPAPAPVELLAELAGILAETEALFEWLELTR